VAGQRLWLALALHAQGKLDDARKELAAAVAKLDGWGLQKPRETTDRLGLHLHDWLEAQIVRREAEKLLGTKRD
jgi:hypothetical protein